MNTDNTLKYLPLGGVTGVTKNMHLYEYNDQILIVDCGIGFADEHMLGVDLMLPDISYLLKNPQKKIVGIAITHGHEDHLGALPYILPQLPGKFDVFATPLAAGFINEKLYKEQGISADSVPSEEMNFKKIVAGRIDVYETSKVVGYETINKILTPDEARLLTHHPNPVGRTDYFMMISKKHPNAKGMADKFDSGLRKLKASGRYEEILAQ